MELLEGTVEIDAGDDEGDHTAAAFQDVDAFVDALDSVSEEHGVTIQAFDARYVVSRRHLERAVELADRERARGEAIARDRGVEILLYAAGRRQIDRALEMGVGEGETPAVVLVAGGSEGDREDSEGGDGAPDGERPGETAAAEDVQALLETGETLGEYDRARVREFFDVSERELSATAAGLEALVLERVALLVVER